MKNQLRIVSSIWVVLLRTNLYTQEQTGVASAEDIAILTKF